MNRRIKKKTRRAAGGAREGIALNEKEKTTPAQESAPAVEPAAEPAAPVEPAPEQKELETLRAQCAETQDKYLRVLAEYDNYRKRSQREREHIYPEATAAAVTRVLGPLDNFERALAAPCTDEQFKKGMQMIFDSLRAALAGMDVTPFGAAGESFDPALHNAVMHVEDSEVGAGVITEVLQVGYKLGSRVLRHAMVKVAN